MTIRSIQEKDLEVVAKLRHQLWPEDIEDDRRELERFFKGFKKHICEVYLLENHMMCNLLISKEVNMMMTKSFPSRSIYFNNKDNL